MIRFFKSPQPVALFFIPALILIFWIQSASSMSPLIEPSGMILWNFIATIFSHFPNWINFIFEVVLVSFSAIYLNIICNKHEVLYKNSYLPALVYALFISAHPAFISFHPIHFVNLILLRVLDKSFSLIKSGNITSAIFDSSFLAGLAALIYFPAVIIIPIMIISITIIRPFNIREWLILIIGFLLPFFFISVWMFWTNNLMFFLKNYSDRFKEVQPHLSVVSNPKLLLLICIFGLWLAIGLLKLRINYFKNVIRTRIVQQILFLFLLFISISFLLQREITIIHFSFLVIPVSVFCAYYLLATKKRIWLVEIFLWILIATIAANHFI